MEIKTSEQIINESSDCIVTGITFEGNKKWVALHDIGKEIAMCQRCASNGFDDEAILDLLTKIIKELENKQLEIK